MTIVNNEKKYIFIHIPKTCGQTIKNTINNDQCLECVDIDYIYKSICYDKFDKIRNPYHFTGKEIIEHFKVNPQKYTVFTFVRNPYDRFYSLYLHTKRELRKNSIPILYTNIILFILTILIYKKVSKNVAIALIIFITIVNIYLIRKFDYIKLSIDSITLTFNSFIRENFNSIYNIYYNYYKPQYLYTRGINLDFIGTEENFYEDSKTILEKIGENGKLKNKNIHTLERESDKYKYIKKFNNYTLRLVNKIYKNDFEVFNYDIIRKISN